MGPELLSLLMSWLPFIVLVIVWVLLWRSMAGKRWWRSLSGATGLELIEQQLAETRRMNATLERIALALEKRVQG